MLYQLITVVLAACDLTRNPRTNRDSNYCRSLGENIQANGQKVPIIGWYHGKQFLVVEGGCRVTGMKMVGLTEVQALDMGKEPEAGDLLLAQASIDEFREQLNPIDRAKLNQAAMKAKNLTAKQYAARLGVSESKISRSLTLLTLPPEAQELIAAGKLDPTKGVEIAMFAGSERQRELALVADQLTRTQLVAMRKQKPATADVKLERVKIALPGQVLVNISGGSMSMMSVVETLAETLKEARKASDACYDVKTWVRMMADKAKKGGTA
ncbi:MAG: ParB/RepB/Spo0J family partition protein [Planctomycetes bacterium]|nr:ParB/RepB/Spo0J family partition protein [Planctomycetota bacterium]